jgi:hypothetical protein
VTIETEASASLVPPAKKRRSGIPTGNAGEYLVMGELLTRGFDAQLADRNTKGYDLLAGSTGTNQLEKIQVKTVRSAPWYVRKSQLQRPGITIYVLLGSPKPKATEQVRYFITRNEEVAHLIHHPPSWEENGLMNLISVEPYDGRWETIPGSN